MSPAGVFFLVAVSFCSGAALKQVVVGQVLETSSQVFSANLESMTPPTLNTSNNKTKTPFQHHDLHIELLGNVFRSLLSLGL